MSNNLSRPSDSNTYLSKFPLNIQMAIRLVASVVRRRLAQQEHSDASDTKKFVKQK